VHSDGIQFYSVDVINLSKTDMLLGPGEAISIAGFPQGLAQIGPAVQTGSGLAVWKTGTLASDMGINVGGKPTFLVDTTSRPGMSGSPVYAVRYNVYRSAISGAVIYKGDGATRFLGVYGQQSTSLEIGVVWKAELVAALYNALP
jgi:hypothetical protein